MVDSFNDWLREQQSRDDRIGDLACDIAFDGRWPDDAT